jgi:hypothetical protein
MTALQGIDRPAHCPNLDLSDFCDCPERCPENQANQINQTNQSSDSSYEPFGRYRTLLADFS